MNEHIFIFFNSGSHIFLIMFPFFFLKYLAIKKIKKKQKKKNTTKKKYRNKHRTVMLVSSILDSEPPKIVKITCNHLCFILFQHWPNRTHNRIKYAGIARHKTLVFLTERNSQLNIQQEKSFN